MRIPQAIQSRRRQNSKKLKPDTRAYMGINQKFFFTENKALA